MPAPTKVRGNAFDMYPPSNMLMTGQDGRLMLRSLCRHQPVDKALANGHTPIKCRGTCKVGNAVVDQELVYEKLPGDIAQRHVLLMDPILATGNSAARAIQVCQRTTCMTFLASVWQMLPY